jgi:eukaryotic-like serine/threonine-protein kinase
MAGSPGWETKMTPVQRCWKCGTVQDPARGLAQCESCDATLETLATPGPVDSSCATVLSGAPDAFPGDSAPPCVRFRDYEVLSEIARGGMGIVFKARQASLNRLVAVKVIRAGQMADRSEIERFLIEARAAANLQHPNIVAIHEIGEDEGQHFFSMDFIEGSSLAEKMRGEPLAPRAAAGYLKTIAEAIHYAHQRGILHRDLKPSNVLIDEKDQPHVTDFGLAKLMTDDSELTATGTVMGSPSYMPPEQAEGRTNEITVRSDIYSLGAILYQSLTGFPPFLGDSPFATMKLVVETEPAPPRQGNTRIPRDLETICLKCLEKNPAKRYGTAQELADELERFLNFQPIHARSLGPLERTARWCRRKPAVAAALLIFVCGFIGVFWQWRRAEAHAANELRLRYEAETASVEALLAQARVTRTSGVAGQRYRSLAALEKAARLRPSPAIRDEMIACLPLVDLRPGREWAFHAAGLTALEFSPDLSLYARANNDGEITICSAGGNVVFARMPSMGEQVRRLQFSPDGKLLAATSERSVAIWSLARAENIFRSTAFTEGVALDFSPDSGSIVAGDATGAIRVFDLISGEVKAQAAIGRACGTIRFNAAGDKFAVCSPDALFVFLFDSASGEEIGRLSHPSYVRDIAWHPEGKLLASACADNQIYVWDWQRGQPALLRGHIAPPRLLAFAQHGYYLVSLGDDKTLRIWDAATRQALVRLEGVSSPGLRLSPDARMLACIVPDSASSQLQLVELIWPEHVRFLPHLNPIARSSSPAAFSEDGRLLAMPGEEGIQLWDISSGTALETVPIGAVQAVAMLGGSQDLLVRGFHGLHRLPLARGRLSGEELLLVGPPQLMDCPPGDGAMAVSRSGHVFVIHDGAVLMLDANNSGRRREFPGQPGLRTLAASPDGSWIAAADWESGEVLVWHTGDSSMKTVLPAGGPANIAFSPDHRWLATATSRECRLWNVSNWTEERSFARAQPGLRPAALTFSPDGSILAWERSGAVDLADAPTGRTLGTIHVPGHAIIQSVQFTPNGGGLLVASEGWPLSIWDLGSINQRLAAFHMAFDSPAQFAPGLPAGDASPPRTIAHVRRIELSHRVRADLERWEIALAEEPANYKGWMELGRINVSIRRFDRAAESFGKASELEPQSTSALVERAFALIKLKRYNEAVEAYQRILAMDPREDRARVHLADACRQLAYIYLQAPGAERNIEAGRRYAQRAFEISPEAPPSMFWMAVSEYWSGRYKEALDHVLRAAEKHPANQTYLFYQAMCEAKLGRTDEARKTFMAALKRVEERWDSYLENHEHFHSYIDIARAVCAGP